MRKERESLHKIKEQYGFRSKPTALKHLYRLRGRAAHCKQMFTIWQKTALSPLQRDGAMPALLTNREVSAPAPFSCRTTCQRLSTARARSDTCTHMRTHAQSGTVCLLKVALTRLVREGLIANNSRRAGLRMRVTVLYVLTGGQLWRVSARLGLNAPRRIVVQGRKPVFGKSSAWERNVPSSKIRSRWEIAIKSVPLLGLIWCCYLTAQHPPSHNLYTL